jgi:CheY-like chemotaxis protein
MLPKVILRDLKSALVDGMEVLRQLRADPRSRCIPLVVLTASDGHRRNGRTGIARGRFLFSVARRNP